MLGVINYIMGYYHNFCKIRGSLQPLKHNFCIESVNPNFCVVKPPPLDDSAADSKKKIPGHFGRQENIFLEQIVFFPFINIMKSAKTFGNLISVKGVLPGHKFMNSELKIS